MKPENSQSVSDQSFLKKVRKFIYLLTHSDGPIRNWRFFPCLILLRKLRSDSAEIRAYAAEGLGPVGYASAVEPLIAVLTDENPSVRKFAISSLGKIGDSRAVDVIIPFLQDEEVDMRCTTVVALGELGLQDKRDLYSSQNVIDALISSVRDMDRSVCSAAVVALGRIGNPQAISALNELAESTESEWIRRYISEALHQIDEQNN
ncbi:HEAT repeat domain-containing protein [Candidatus Poribacteria bacterium]|nr:HEAT repeat domain-containing protein [Candidatus Poribacteria bacterium]